MFKARLDKRRDRRYGGLIERRDVASGSSTTGRSVIRHIPCRWYVASRRGPGNEWVFGFGELRGNRFFTNEDGEFVQEVDYEPFGEASRRRRTGAANYTSYQWNGGDALAAFGLSHLGRASTIRSSAAFSPAIPWCFCEARATLIHTRLH